MQKQIKYIDNTKQLGIKLKRARENAGFTQSKVSNAVGLNRSSLAYYELGKTTPTIFTIIKLAVAEKV